MTISGVPSVAQFDGDAKLLFRRLSSVVNTILQGKINAVTTVTLTAGTTTTTITDARITSKSFIGLTPTTANAAAAIPTTYISSQMTGTGTTQGTATITHANNAQTDRTFNILIIG